MYKKYFNIILLFALLAFPVVTFAQSGCILGICLPGSGPTLTNCDPITQACPTGAVCDLATNLCQWPLSPPSGGGGPLVGPPAPGGAAPAGTIFGLLAVFLTLFARLVPILVSVSVMVFM